MTEIRKVILRGFFWSITNQASSTLLTILISAVLSRLITPAEFGIVGMVTMITGFLNTIKDFGFGAALVQKKNVTDDEYSTIFWINILIGVLLCFVVYTLSDSISNFFDEPDVAIIAKVMSFTFIINSIGIIWGNRLVKDVAFDQIFYRRFIALVVSGVCGICIAIAGYGMWALVSQVYVNLLVVTILSYWRVKWLPKLVLNWSYIKDLTKFSLPLFTEQAVNYWFRNIDNLLVGKILGKESLAFYNKAYSLMLLPVRQLTGTLTKVLFPSFSLIQDDKVKIGSIYLKISRSIAFISFPLMIILSTLSESVIIFLYGEQWSPSIPIFRILSLLGMFQSIGALTGNIYMSQGKTALLFKVGLFTKGLMIMGIVIGLISNGIMGMVYGYCFASLVAFLPDLYFVGMIIELSLIKIVRNFIPYLLMALTSGLVVFVTNFYLDDLLGTHFFIVVVNSLIGFAVYLLLSMMFRVPAYIEILELLRSKFR